MEMELGYENDESLVLDHSGVKGMKWGQRRYQNPDGTYTDLGKERRRVGYVPPVSADEEKIGGKAYKDMTPKELRAAKKRARHNEKERREQREFNRDKKEAIAAGDLDFATKNLSKFSNEEINEVVNRYKTMQSLKELDSAEKNKKLNNFIDKSLYYLDKADRGTRSISNISNNLNDMRKKSAERKQAEVDLEKRRVSLEKDMVDLEYFKDPKKKPLTKKEELELEKAKKELEYLKDPSKKPLTEKEKVELEYLKDPSKKPLTKKEQIELENAEQELEWKRNPLDRPLSAKEILDLRKQKADIAKVKEDIKKTQSEIKKNEEMARVNEEAANYKEAELREKKIALDEQKYERDEKKRAWQRKKLELDDAEEDTDNARKALKEAKRNSATEAEIEYWEKNYDYYKARERDIRNETDLAKKDYNKAEDDCNTAQKSVNKAEDDINATRKAAKKAAKKAAADAKDLDDAIKDLAKQQKDYGDKTGDYDFFDSYFSGKFGSVKTNKKQVNTKAAELDPKDIDRITNKYLHKLQSQPQKIGYSLDRKGNVTTDARDLRWKKTMNKKAGDSRVIDDWVKEMKKKYMVEGGMDAAAAEKKAEKYVDYWIDLYDDGKLQGV